MISEKSRALQAARRDVRRSTVTADFGHEKLRRPRCKMCASRVDVFCFIHVLFYSCCITDILSCSHTIRICLFTYVQKADADHVFVIGSYVTSTSCSHFMFFCTRARSSRSFPISERPVARCPQVPWLYCVFFLLSLRLLLMHFDWYTGLLSVL